MAATNKKMVATYVYPDGPREKTVVNMKIVRKEIGKAFKKQSKPVQEALAALSQDFGKALEFEAKLAADGSASLDTSDGPMTVLRNMVSFTEVTKKVNEEKYTPSVVEPSFGIGRILYALMEQSFAPLDLCKRADVLFNTLQGTTIEVSEASPVSSFNFNSFLPRLRSLGIVRMVHQQSKVFETMIG